MKPRTCDRCKWWNRDVDYNNGYHKCKNKKLDDGKSVDGALPEALDDTGIHFATGPKFGCIHFEFLKQPMTQTEVMSELYD